MGKKKRAYGSTPSKNGRSQTSDSAGSLEPNQLDAKLTVSEARHADIANANGIASDFPACTQSQEQPNTFLISVKPNDLEALMVWFSDVARKDSAANLSFSASLSREARALVHKTVESKFEQLLETCSQGVEEERYIAVRKKGTGLKREVDPALVEKCSRLWKCARDVGISISRDELLERMITDTLPEPLARILAQLEIPIRDAAALQLLLRAAADGNLPLLERLIGQNTELVASNVPEPISGALPLHAAAAQGHEEAVLVLLKAGAGLEACDGKGRTALQVARMMDQCDIEAVLLGCGAKDDSLDSSILENSLDLGTAGEEMRKVSSKSLTDNHDTEQVASAAVAAVTDDSATAAPPAKPEELPTIPSECQATAATAAPEDASCADGDSHEALVLANGKTVAGEAAVEESTQQPLPEAPATPTYKEAVTANGNTDSAIAEKYASTEDGDAHAGVDHAATPTYKEAVTANVDVDSAPANKDASTENGDTNADFDQAVTPTYKEAVTAHTELHSQANSASTSLPETTGIEEHNQTIAQGDDATTATRTQGEGVLENGHSAVKEGACVGSTCAEDAATTTATGSGIPDESEAEAVKEKLATATCTQGEEARESIDAAEEANATVASTCAEDAAATTTTAENEALAEEPMSAVEGIVTTTTTGGDIPVERKVEAEDHGQACAADASIATVENEAVAGEPMTTADDTTTTTTAVIPADNEAEDSSSSAEKATTDTVDATSTEHERATDKLSSASISSPDATTTTTTTTSPALTENEHATNTLNAASTIPEDDTTTTITTITTPMKQEPATDQPATAPSSSENPPITTTTTTTTPIENEHAANTPSAALATPDDDTTTTKSAIEDAPITTTTTTNAVTPTATNTEPPTDTSTTPCTTTTTQATTPTPPDLSIPILPTPPDLPPLKYSHCTSQRFTSSLDSLLLALPGGASMQQWLQENKVSTTTVLLTAGMVVLSASVATAVVVRGGKGRRSLFW